MKHPLRTTLAVLALAAFAAAPVRFLKLKGKIFLLALAGVLQAACGSNAVYTGESFATDSPFKMKFDSEVATACESARRSLLGQGYLIDVATVDTVKGRKALRNKDSLSTVSYTHLTLPTSDLV